MECECYVSQLSEEVRFGLHFGAHNPTCPRYRVSLDPVDRENDDEFREGVEPLVERPRETRGRCEDAPCCGCCGPGTGGPGDYYGGE